MTVELILYLVFALMPPVGVFLGYRFGLKDAQALAAGRPIEFWRAGTPPAQGEGAERMRTLLANIDAYDGTGRGQAEI